MARQVEHDQDEARGRGANSPAPTPPDPFRNGPWPKVFTTRTGLTLTLRPIRPDDAPRLVEFFYALSPETRYRRFHTAVPDLPEEEVWRRVPEFVDVPPERGGAIIALDGETIAGSARAMRQPDAEVAEAAVVVRDDYQGQGIGSRLLQELITLARLLGIKRLFAYIQPDNRRILQLLQQARLPVRTVLEGGELRVEVDVTGQPDASP